MLTFQAEDLDVFVDFDTKEDAYFLIEALKALSNDDPDKQQARELVERLVKLIGVNLNEGLCVEPEEFGAMSGALERTEDESAQRWLMAQSSAEMAAEDDDDEDED